MNIFGEFYGRNGAETVNIVISDETIQELIEANAEDEDKFENLIEAHTDLDKSIGFYTAIESIGDMIRENKYLILPFSIIEEEYTYGCGVSEDAARIAFTNTGEEV